MSVMAGQFRPHHMVHPGPVAEDRVEWAASRTIHVERRAGKAGQSLLGAIAEAAFKEGLASGTGRLRGCRLAQTRFTTGGPARDGKAANYTFIRDWGVSHLPWATFSFGTTPDGARFVHCHAMIENSETDEPVGGHLFPADCVLDGAVSIELFGPSDVDLVQQQDAETLHSVFEIGERRDAMDGDALFVRVRPNEDVVLAIETACRANGIDNAVLAPSLGSLNAPVIVGADGTQRALPSVGMEVLRFSGSVHQGRADIDVVIVDEAGTPHAGRLERGLAPVCVTAELLLVRSDQPAAIS